VASVSIVLLIAATPTNAAVPTFPHLRPSAYMAPMKPGFFQLTWVGLLQFSHAAKRKFKSVVFRKLNIKLQIAGKKLAFLHIYQLQRQHLLIVLIEIDISGGRQATLM
jgi:hypothetical protein